MMTTILTWLGLTTASHAVKKTLDVGLDRLSSDKLSSELAASIHEWASGFAQSGVADTLIKVLFAPLYAEPGPARTELRKTIEEQRLPSAEAWFLALYERWIEVRQSGNDVQPFFLMDLSRAGVALQDLASRLDRVCRSDSSLFQVTMVDMMISMGSTLANVERLFVERESSPPPTADEIIEKLRAISAALLRYPSTVTHHDHFIPRPELSSLIERIATTSWSATVLLGERGGGKSSLLSRIANEAIARDWALLAIKADMLPASITAESFARSIGVEMSLVDAIRHVAKEKRVVVLIDQVDAIAEVSDRKSDRLNILLDLVHRLSSLENVHVVLSSREFEFRTDSRLTSLQFESLRLELPPFDSVAGILEEAEHRTARFGDVLRELLRNPLALKIFLDVARPEDQFASLGSLLERYWSTHVTGAPHGDGRVTLLERMADRMTEEEHLSVPLPIADDLPDALQGLFAAEMLIAEERSLAFRHQAFYEFTVARRFGSGRADLVAHVFERQDGLFVRPTILTTLVLLRETSRREYERVVTSLMSDREIRPHVKALVTDFLGSQREPLPVEVNLLLPLLDEEVFAPRALNAVAGSSGWFGALQGDARFLRWLRDPGRAFRCLALLTSAVESQPDSVLVLILRHWINDATFDNLTAQVVRQFEHVSDAVATIVMVIIQRTASVDWLVEHVGAINAEAGARLVGIDLERRIRQACDALKDVDDPNEIRGSFEQLVGRDDRHELLSDIATKAPLEFLTATWKPFVQIAQILAHDVRHPNLAYRRSWTFEIDRGPIPNPPILHALRIALRSYAETAPDGFLKFVKDSASCEVTAVHALLAEGLEAVGATHATEVLEYLLADQRRLAIGPEGNRNSDSARLIAAIHGHLSQEDRQRLQSAILSFAAHVADPSDDAEKRRAIVRWNRHHRFGLLKALDCNFIEDSLRQHIAAEERFFGGEGPLRLGVKMYWVGPRMKQHEIEKASDEDLLKLVDQLTDDTPRRNRSVRVDPERSGGAEQLADEIGKAVQQSPDRALRLIEHLDPTRQQSYAPSLMEALIKSGTQLETVSAVVQRLDDRGFRSDSFRRSVGWELHERGKGSGLPDPIVAILERWLDEMPVNGEDESHFVQDSHRQPILAGYHFGGGWPSRGSVFAGFSVGLLDRSSPAVQRWIERVRKEVRLVGSLSFWELVLGHMATCFNEDSDSANALLDEILVSHPALFERTLVLACLGRYWPALQHARVRGWLRQMRDMPAAIAQQGWGELFMLQNEFGEAEERTIADALDADQIDTMFGLAYGSNYAWRIEARRPIAAAVLMRIIDRLNADCADPLSRFLLEFDADEPIDPEAESVIRMILANSPLVEKLVSELLAAIEPRTTTNPALAYEVTKRLLDIGEVNIANPSSLLFAHAGDLTTLALTLHRQPEYRPRGLELFERLIALNVYEAEAALELLDRRAARRYTPRPRRRVPRRRRQRSTSAPPAGN